MAEALCDIMEGFHPGTAAVKDSGTVDCFVGLLISFFLFLSGSKRDEQTRSKTSAQLRWAEPRGADERLLPGLQAGGHGGRRGRGRGRG